MRHVLELKKLFGKHLDWNASRLTFLSLFIISMLQQKTVNLTQISNGFATRGKKSGKVRRTEDFFRKFKISTYPKLITYFSLIPYNPKTFST